MLARWEFFHFWPQLAAYFSGCKRWVVPPSPLPPFLVTTKIFCFFGRDPKLKPSCATTGNGANPRVNQSPIGANGFVIASFGSVFSIAVSFSSLKKVGIGDICSSPKSPLIYPKYSPCQLGDYISYRSHL